MLKTTVKIATLQLTGCAGCHLSLLDALNELPQLVNNDTIQILYSHMLMDEKDLEENVDLLIVEGGISKTDEEEILLKFATKSNKVFALGGCACFRGIAAQGNFIPRQELMEEYYIKQNPGLNNKVPNDDLPQYFEFFHGIDGTVEVDYSLLGCPPDPTELRDAILAILNEKEPSITTKIVCDECPRERNKDPAEASLEPMKRLISVIPDEDTCLVDQGLICMGHATRAGCGAKCPKAGYPCEGCFGPALKSREIAPNDLASFTKRLASQPGTI